jgi:hypothetical protein
MTTSAAWHAPRAALVRLPGLGEEGTFNRGYRAASGAGKLPEVAR